MTLVDVVMKRMCESLQCGSCRPIKGTIPQCPVPLEDVLPKATGSLSIRNYSSLKKVEAEELSNRPGESILFDCHGAIIKAWAKTLHVSSSSLLNAILTKVFFEESNVENFIYQHIISADIPQIQQGLKRWEREIISCQHGFAVDMVVQNLQGKSAATLALEYDVMTKNPMEYFSFEKLCAFNKAKNAELEGGVFNVQISYPSISFSNMRALSSVAASKVIDAVYVAAPATLFLRSRNNGFFSYLYFHGSYYISLNRKKQKNHFLDSDILQKRVVAILQSGFSGSL